MNAEDFPKTYEPQRAEARWYRMWEERGYFKASNDPKDTRPTYTIAIPPPNVTGYLHMGHACRATFEDVLIRYHRMLGYNTLWIPGTDHAGIATQVVVERQLKAEGLDRHELGREKFIERVWKWRQQSGDRIFEQQRVLGASCDWSRAKFTMDPDMSAAVTEAFVRLHEEGLIYRAARLVNWDVQTQTVLSDLEVETQENVQGELYDFAYPIDPADGGGEIIVSTTRPETMLGDSAVAVHPDDERYAHLHGKHVQHPFVDRRIPIIVDAELVDPEFGSGVVKVTPAHDPNDFATGKRHNLEFINIFNLDGTLNESAGPFQGMERFAARKAIKQALQEKGLERGSRKHTMTLPRSERSGTIVEPMISTQWFVSMKSLAAPAIEAVKDGRTQIIPEDWSKTYFHWLQNILYWCFSRQLWWGHQIPAYHCEQCQAITVCRQAPCACEACGSNALQQDPDVLDTWFSSALWPFSTLGWPEKSPDLARFYPTSDMETGYDILFFWVARMMMMGLHFMGDVPFRRILLAGMVTDEHGQKMSKVKGNVIDPLHVIQGISVDDLLAQAKAMGASEQGLKTLKKNYPDGFEAYGTDALRATLLSYSPQTRKIPLSLKRIEGYRNFCNKLWNAARYVLMSLEPSSGSIDAQDQRFKEILARTPVPTAVENRWILSRLNSAVKQTRQSIDAYRLDEAMQILYHFVWDEYCDWYLELSKPLLSSADPALREQTAQCLLYSLDVVLRAMHPMLPFITEEVWQRLPKPAEAPGSIMIAPYPDAADIPVDADAEAVLAAVQPIITAARTIRAEHDLPRAKRIPLHLYCPDESTAKPLHTLREAISVLCNADVSINVSAPEGQPPGTAISLINSITIMVPLQGLVDPHKEIERLTKELARTRKDLAAIEKKLANPSFVQRAPAELVGREQARLSELKQAEGKLTATLQSASARSTRSVP